MFWKKNNNNANTAPASKPLSYSSVKIHPSVDHGVLPGKRKLRRRNLALPLRPRSGGGYDQGQLRP